MTANILPSLVAYGSQRNGHSEVALVDRRTPIDCLEPPTPEPASDRADLLAGLLSKVVSYLEANRHRRPPVLADALKVLLHRSPDSLAAIGRRHGMGRAALSKVVREAAACFDLPRPAPQLVEPCRHRMREKWRQRKEKAAASGRTLATATNGTQQSLPVNPMPPAVVNGSETMP